MLLHNIGAKIKKINKTNLKMRINKIKEYG